MREDIPSPKIGGAPGSGAEFDRFIIDLALYGDPTKTYVEQDNVFTSVGTLVLKS